MIDNSLKNVMYVNDLMNYFGFGRDKAYALMRSDDFPSMQIGKTYVITKNNFNKWLNDHEGMKIEV